MGRPAYGVAVLGALGGVAALGASACLPDLVVNLCGNGRIDPGEQCDPGANASDGCSKCKIVCPVSSEYRLDTNSDHCYYTFKERFTYDNGAHTCGDEAHPVTLDDPTELELVSDLFHVWPDNARYWLGLTRSVDVGPFLAAAQNEPGWNSPVDCAGCYLYGATSSELASVDAGAEAGADDCVVGTVESDGLSEFRAAGCDAKLNLVCEREPVGSRSSPCALGAAPGSYCFDVLATVSTGRSYVFVSTPATADAAEATCRSLSDAGTPALVIFDTRREREQVNFELFQLSQLTDGPQFPQSGYWIGLSSQGDAPDASASSIATDWVWDDGVRPSPSPTGARPSIWGNRQPRTTGRARALVEFGSAYDTGLAYAVPDDSPDGPSFYPFVCEY